MRRLPFFFALSFLSACGLVEVRPPTVIPARDLSRLAVVAEALLRDDRYPTVDKLEAHDGFGEDGVRGLRLEARRDDGNANGAFKLISAAKKGGWNGFLSQLTADDKSNASNESTVRVELYPRPGGHEVRVFADNRHKGADGHWQADGTPYGYTSEEFARRLMRAYGPADVEARPVYWPKSRPLPLKDPLPDGQTAGSQDQPLPTPAPTPHTRRSNMLFGPQAGSDTP
jgi:hypothetical protein